MAQFIVIALLGLAHLACLGQTDQTTEEFNRMELKSMYDYRAYVFNASGQLVESSDAAKGKGIIIQNSYPKGDRYVDPTGKGFGSAIFWTRIINETAATIELVIGFPADSFPVPSSPDAYLKLFIPSDTMTVDKESLYNYGATGLKSFLDAGLRSPTMLQKTINPGEECLFYIGALSYQAGGMVRTGLVLKEHDLFYRISIVPHFESALFPCGQITVKP